MDKVQEINLMMQKLLEELTVQPFGLDVSLESFDAKEMMWTVRMKEHFISFSEIEITKAWESKDNLYIALKDLFMEKFQWLTWQSI